MFGGGGSSSPPQVKPVDQAALDAQQAEAAAAQNKLAGKRRGVASTRLTDPATDLFSSPGAKAKGRVSLLGGGDTSGS
jgi:hypothetical protein